jgi:8-oxo-dGTP diphosphatase
MTAPPGYDASKFPPFALTADVALLNTDGGQLRVVLVQRRNEPFQGRWALPGGFVDIDEDLESAAIRELVEETGLRCEKLTQLGAYGDPDRDPRMRVVTVVFWAHLTDLPEPIRGDDAADARIWDMDEVLARPDLLAFDHHQILTDVRSAYEAAT